MSKFWKNKQPAEQSAAPLGAIEVREDASGELLVEIRDLLKKQVEFNDWLKQQMIDNGIVR